MAPDNAVRAPWHAQWATLPDKDGVEVDMVLEGDGQRLAGIEVKASATVTPADFKGLRKLKEAVAERFAAGVVLYDGESTVPFGDRLFAVPIRSLWEPATGHGGSR